MTNPKIIKIPEGPRNKALSYDGGVSVGQKAGANRGGRFSHSFNRTPYAPTGSGGGNNYKLAVVKFQNIIPLVVL